MKKLVSTIIITLIYLTSYSQQGDKMNGATLAQQQKNFAESKGFEQYLYGTSIKKYKGFKLIPTQAVFQQYGSHASFKYNDILIDSVQLFFYKDKLYTIELFINKFEREKMTIILEKLYGPNSSLLGDAQDYIWRGNTRKLSIYPVGKKNYAVHFESLENINERMNATLDELMK